MGVTRPLHSLEATWLGPPVTDSHCEKMVVDDIRVLHVKSYDNSQDKEMTLIYEL